jgi:DNA repair exonuclease SbcCD ATPase subunit
MRTQGKRKIGIISHVEAINDRIKAQIRVVPEGGNGGHSKITIQG